MRAEAAGFGAQVFAFLYYQSWPNILLASLIRTKLHFTATDAYESLFLTFSVITPHSQKFSIQIEMINTIVTYH